MILGGLKKKKRRNLLVCKKHKYSVGKGVKFCGFEFRFSRNYFWVREILLLDTAEDLHDAVRSR